MSFIARLMGLHPTQPRIPEHLSQAVMAEWVRGNMSGAQANAAIAAQSGGIELDAAGIAEAQAIVNTVPTGSTSALKADRALRLLEIDQILLLACTRSAPYDTEDSVKQRLGI